MSQTGENKQQFENIDQASDYMESVRAHYRAGHGNYSGRRNEEQQIIAEITADEARTIVDGVAVGLLAVTGAEISEDYEESVTMGGHAWKDFRGEFERLLVGVGVLTNRLERDGYDVKGYADMGVGDRMKVASVLFSDFLTHNALRFGTETVGIHKSVRKTVHTEDGGIEHQVKIVDKDKPQSKHELERNMKKRGFATDVSAHPAGKISPAKYRELRRAYPEMDKDAFDRDISFYKNVEAEFANRE